MTSDTFTTERRFFVPEVVQTSAMDCGPATLKCLLEGFGISASYGRLREACQTSVDGTSINTLEEVAIKLGLIAEQIMVPADHLLLPQAQALPAVVVVRLPNGLVHFVVAWRVHGPFVQIMDPSTGRRWLTHSRFLGQVYVHTYPLPAETWRDWAGSEGFCEPLTHCIFNLGIESTQAETLIDTASQDPGWHSFAALDAATRMVSAMVRAGGLDRGEEAGGVLHSFFEKARKQSSEKKEIIPSAYWSVRVQTDTDDEEEHLCFKGAVLVHVEGRRTVVRKSETDEPEEHEEAGGESEPLSPELIAALEEEPTRPELEILRFLRKDGLLTPAVLTAALAMAAYGLAVEVLLLRGLLDICHTLNLFGQRIGVTGAVLIFVTGLLFLEIPVSVIILRMSQRLEIRLRIVFLKKIPRLSDRYFHSRLTSDMAQRVHELRQIRTLPGLGANFLRLCFQIILTAAGVICLFPNSALLAILATFFSIAISFAAQPLLTEQDLRLRTHIGALSRFYLDALLGLIPIRTHCAERAVRREHGSLLLEWIRSGMDFLKAEILIQAVEALVGTGFAIWILFNYISQGGEASGVLLLFYWTLNLPALGNALAGFAKQYPMHRNRILRLLEPLGAPDETEINGHETSEHCSQKTAEEKGVAISLENVSVRTGGQTILNNINCTMQPREHIAIVGPSGAGKSTLAGLFLGWHRPSPGRILIDGELLTGQRLQSFRQEIAWVDPAVQIWNRTFFENLHYGATISNSSPITSAIEKADLLSVLERLPHGLQTNLGEGGGLVSGGEGQRVRLGRAMLRSGVRLVILDEPFRGLDREKRRELLVRSREHWQGANLIFISHDVRETQIFERVLVIEHGKIAEDDAPENLAASPGSRYHAMLASEKAVWKEFWSGTKWRRLRLNKGRLSEKN
ncbi:ATP-binding cassette domain-containing protein [Desulfonema magnum]|uniref:ABC transporter, permease protein n=1 Tax=Desulfonema magnum TaxID=45655 RepID=A0A975BGF3_9BACT|nr:ATP-binding cassette domain-containing protein [Desulfonema magnum]QTA84815.1 putative ABC transporter, permease protein [Desulfonema magnum]